MNTTRMPWSVAGASVRGASHQRADTRNQDSFECVEAGADTPAIVAIADGHGSQVHFRSHIGSALGVSVAIAEVQQVYRRSGQGISSLFAEGELATLSRAIVEAWRRAVLSDLQQQPLSSEEWAAVEAASGAEALAMLRATPEIAYGATLLVAAATASQVIYLQLGDGEILAVDAAGRTWRPLPADERLTGNQTTSLCQPEAWKEFRCAVAASPHLPALILLSTDGYVNSFRSDDDFLQTGQDYLRIVREQGMAALKEELPQILTEASHHGSGDDISLVVLQGDTRFRSGAAGEAKVAAAREPEQLCAPSRQRADREGRDYENELTALRLRNRNLLRLLVLLAIAGLAAPSVIFRHQLAAAWASLHTKHPVPCAARGRGAYPCGPVDTPPHPVPTAKALPEVEAAHDMLRLDSGAQIDLVKGAVIPQEAIVHTGRGRYAEVASDHGALEIINRSTDIWKVHVSGKKDHAVPPGGSVRVQAETEIAFTPKERGTIVRVDGADGSLTRATER